MAKKIVRKKSTTPAGRKTVTKVKRTTRKVGARAKKAA
jgi:hypothetical protein